MAYGSAVPSLGIRRIAVHRVGRRPAGQIGSVLTVERVVQRRGALEVPLHADELVVVVQGAGDDVLRPERQVIGLLTPKAPIVPDGAHIHLNGLTSP